MTDTAHTSASRTLREIASWQPVKGSADNDLLPELSTIVSRSRDLARNHGIASGAIQTLSDNIVGLGFRLSAKPDYKALGKTKEWEEEWQIKVENLWRSWSETFDCDAARKSTFNGLTTLVFKSCLINGEALALPLWLKDRKYSTAIQLIEPDRLSNPNDGFDTDKLRGGIEIDGYGGAVAYHIRKTHPGDYWTGKNTSEWERIPAFTPFGRRRVIHVFDTTRIGQTRGKPVLSSIMPMFKMLDHYERSELQAAIVNAMIAAFIETPMEGENLNELFGGSSDDYLNAKKDWKVKLGGGSIIPIFPGDIHFCKKHNVHHIELRKINAQNILNIKDIDIEKIALLLSKNNIRVSCIASPFLKWDRKNNQTSSDFNFYKHKDDVYYLNKLIQIADIFSTNNIRIFSYIKSTDFDMSNFVDYLKRVDEFLEQKNKNFLLENEPICNISHIHHLYTLFHENKFKHIFPLIDLGNAYFLEEAIDRNELEFLKKSCFYYHIKDFNGEQKCYVPLGKGNINFFDLVIKKMRKDSFLSLETHTKKKEDVEISLNELRRITNA